MPTVASLVVKIGSDIKGLEKGISKAQRKLQDAGRSMQRVGRTLTRSVTLPIAAMGVASIKAAGDFEQSFADIRKTVSATPAQFAALSKEMRGMAKTIPTSVNELNHLAGIAGQLGIETKNISSFTKTIAMLGDTTNIAGEQAALSLSRFMNVMGTAQSDIDRLGATIVALGNNFAATESEIVDIATSMAPLGNSIGLTEQQVLAFSTTIAASGGEARAASTAFQKTANIMKRAVIEGNDDLQTFAKTAGMTADQFKKSFQDDAGAALESFLQGLKRVQKSGGSMAATLDELGLADQRLIREFGKVVGNLDQLNPAIQTANKGWKQNTALTQEAQKRYETFNSRLKILYNRVYDVGIQVGNALIPVINKLIKVTESITKWFEKLDSQTIAIGATLAGLTAIIGPVTFALGLFIEKTTVLIAALPKLITLVKSLTAAMVSNPYIAVGVAIAAIGVKAYMTYTKIEKLNDSIKDVLKDGIDTKSWKQLRDYATVIEDKISKIYDLNKKSPSGFGGAGQLGHLKELNNRLSDTKKRIDELRPVGVLRRSSDLFSGMFNMGGFSPKDLIVKPKVKPDIQQPKAPKPIKLPVQPVIPKIAPDLPSIDELTKGVDLDLGKKMFPPDSLGGLQQRLQKLRNKMQWATNPKQFGELQNSVDLTKQKIAELTNQTSRSTAVLGGFLTTLDTIFQQAVIHGGNLLSILGKIAKQLASKALINGLAMLLSGGTFGVGKLLFGSVGSILGLASGGLAFGPTMAMVGDNPGARSNPEVIAPLDKLKSMIGGGTQRIIVEGKIKGQDIYLSNQRGKTKFNR